MIVCRVSRDAKEKRIEASRTEEKRYIKRWRTNFRTSAKQNLRVYVCVCWRVSTDAIRLVFPQYSRGYLRSTKTIHNSTMITDREGRWHIDPSMRLRKRLTINLEWIVRCALADGRIFSGSVPIQILIYLDFFSPSPLLLLLLVLRCCWCAERANEHFLTISPLFSFSQRESARTLIYKQPGKQSDTVRWRRTRVNINFISFESIWATLNKDSIHHHPHLTHRHRHRHVHQHTSRSRTEQISRWQKK